MRTVTRIFVILILVGFFGLLGVFIYGSVATNRMVAQLAGWPAGTPLADIVAAHGQPDQLDDVNGTWTWGRRAWRLPDDVKQVAVYFEAIIPQVCVLHLDANQRVLRIERFSAYPRRTDDSPDEPPGN